MVADKATTMMTTERSWQLVYRRRDGLLRGQADAAHEVLKARVGA